jgi:hypothetical protein
MLCGIMKKAYLRTIVSALLVTFVTAGHGCDSSNDDFDEKEEKVIFDGPINEIGGFRGLEDLTKVKLSYREDNYLKIKYTFTLGGEISIEKALDNNRNDLTNFEKTLRDNVIYRNEYTNSFFSFDSPNHKYRKVPFNWFYSTPGPYSKPVPRDRLFFNKDHNFYTTRDDKGQDWVGLRSTQLPGEVFSKLQNSNDWSEFGAFSLSSDRYELFEGIL